jgi:hypothetical protein
MILGKMLTLNKKIILKKSKKQFVCNFNPSNNYDVEWDNLKSHLKKYVKIHETKVLDNLFSNEMVDDASNLNKNILLTNAENIEPYNISYKNLVISIIKTKFLNAQCFKTNR